MLIILAHYHATLVWLYGSANRLWGKGKPCLLKWRCIHAVTIAVSHARVMKRSVWIPYKHNDKERVRVGSWVINVVILPTDIIWDKYFLYELTSVIFNWNSFYYNNFAENVICIVAVCLSQPHCDHWDSYVGKRNTCTTSRNTQNTANVMIHDHE